MRSETPPSTARDKKNLRGPHSSTRPKKTRSVGTHTHTSQTTPPPTTSCRPNYHRAPYYDDTPSTKQFDRHCGKPPTPPIIIHNNGDPKATQNVGAETASFASKKAKPGSASSKQQYARPAPITDQCQCQCSGAVNSSSSSCCCCDSSA